MNFRAASNILRKPWLMEPSAAIHCLQLFEESRISGGKFSWKNEETDNRIQSVVQGRFSSKQVSIAPVDFWEAKEHPGYEGSAIAVLPLMGPLMKEDYCGWFGTASLKAELMKMRAASSVKEIILWVDSPGGMVDGTESFANAFAEAAQNTTTIVDGMMCSAAYWIGSKADQVIASNLTDEIGSIGTMIRLVDRRQAMETAGYKILEYYATDSKDKNLDFREALDGNGKKLIANTLDPLNDIFLASVKAARGTKLNQKETLSGRTFLATAAVENGLVDKVEPSETTLNNLVQKHQSKDSNMATKWQKMKAFFGFKAEDQVKMTDEHLDKVETLVSDNEQLVQENTALKEAAKENGTKITSLEQENEKLQKDAKLASDKISELEGEVKKLGEMDGGKLSSTAADKDPAASEKSILDANEMDFQQELYERV